MDDKDTWNEWTGKDGWIWMDRWPVRSLTTTKGYDDDEGCVRV